MITEYHLQRSEKETVSDSERCQKSRGVFELSAPPTSLSVSLSVTATSRHCLQLHAERGVREISGSFERDVLQVLFIQIADCVSV